MKTDKHVYQVFELHPEWLFDLSGQTSPGESRVQSVAVKAIERTIDVLVVPNDSESPLTVVEFQFQPDPHIYTRTAVEMALIQQEFRMRPIRGIIIFRHSNHDPKTEPW